MSWRAAYDSRGGRDPSRKTRIILQKRGGIVEGSRFHNL